MTDNDQVAYSAPPSQPQIHKPSELGGYYTPTRGFLGDVRCAEVVIPSREKAVDPQDNWRCLPLEIQAEIFLMCLPSFREDRAPPPPECTRSTFSHVYVEPGSKLWWNSQRCGRQSPLFVPVAPQ
ncbi:hypothetical protein P691DRAFT_158523 [Macrolepiota fuliginosa MF-IS2]|uniref:Uncharacterized protein n=1 Tax=Macrolepiota fuliginosa MF-IS2 TaxID=1400762 RepID=A0A9P5XBJ4_9AGAR|nr:hypothetical protein P691DRAFT_158523 [Macrolepiota fuliginosa MF-IS2]